MAEGYRAYLIGEDGPVVSRIDLFCHTEEDAKQRAQMLVDGHPVELWQEARRIATFEPEQP